MTEEQAMVEEFHRKFDIVTADRPTEIGEDTKRLRVRLIQEEFDELKESMEDGNLAALAKEMADLVSFLSAYRYYLTKVGEAANPVSGAAVFEAKGCPKCHANSGETSSVRMRVPVNSSCNRSTPKSVAMASRTGRRM